MSPLNQLRSLYLHLVDLSKEYLLPVASYHLNRQPSRPRLSEPTLINDFYFINLLDQKSQQGLLGMVFHRTLGLLQKVLSDGAAYRSLAPLQTELGASLVGSGKAQYDEMELKGQLQELNRSETFSQSFSLYGMRRLPGWLPKKNQALTLRHLWFDYHHKILKDSKSILEIKRLLEAGLTHRGLFIKSFGAIPSRFQQAVFRTNCLDCLDRTNVVQTFISKWALELQMEALLGRELSLNRKHDLASPLDEVQ